MNNSRFEKYDIKRRLLNEWLSQQFRLQHELMTEILNDGNDIGGLLGTIKGENGTYDVESVYFTDEMDSSKRQIICHLNYPSFETDVCFDDFSVSERQQIIELTIKLLSELN